MSEQTIEELRAALDKERKDHGYSRNAHATLGLMYRDVARENEGLKMMMDIAVTTHGQEMQAARLAHDKLAEELENTQRALAATQLAYTLALEARDDAQAFQMTGF